MISYLLFLGSFLWGKPSVSGRRHLLNYLITTTVPFLCCFSKRKVVEREGNYANLSNIHSKCLFKKVLKSADCGIFFFKACCQAGSGKSPSHSLRCTLTASKDEVTKLYVLNRFGLALLDLIFTRIICRWKISHVISKKNYYQWDLKRMVQWKD